MYRTLVAGASLLAVGCAAVVAAPGGPPGVGYDEALAQWTAKAQAYHGVDKVADVAATFQSGAFREARARQSAGTLGLSPAAAQTALANEETEAAAENDFFLGAWIDPSADNDLGRRGSVWSVSLQLPDGRTLSPLGIQQFYRPNENQVALYPYLKHFWMGYWIRFPAADEQGKPYLARGGRMVLRLASSLGRVELPFELPAAP